MELTKIFKNVEHKILNFYEEIKYEDIECDSKKIKQNDIFFAKMGYTVDGHDYIDEAINNGAKLIIVTDEKYLNFKENINKKNINYVFIRNPFDSGKIASNFYNSPQNKLKIIGVTGTNGKTSVTYFLESVLVRGNIAKIGTIEYQVGTQKFESKNTTPEAIDIIKICNLAVKKKIKYLVMEVSSHALELHRVDELKFDAAIFTNLTQDHLDFHKNMDRYFLAKLKLFEKLKNRSNGIVNIDDSYGMRIKQKFINVKTYSKIDKEADLWGEVKKQDFDRTFLELIYNGSTYEIETKILGDYNLYNIMATFLALIRLDLEPKLIIKKIEKMKQIPGRFEKVKNNKNILTVIDFAHTPDAMVKILENLSRFEHNKIITLFGAGGDRDVSKRAKMAKVAAKYSDYIVITSDNPRNENPMKIINDVEKGLIKINYSRQNYEKITDREKAIKHACQIATKNDIILFAGKGHETYQVIKNEKHYFSDKNMIDKYLNS